MGDGGSQTGVRRMSLIVRGRSDTSPLQSRAMLKYQGSWHPWCCCGGRVMQHVASVWRAQSPSTHLLKLCNRQQVISGWIRQVGGAALRFRIAAAVTVAAARLMLRGALLR